MSHHGQTIAWHKGQWRVKRIRAERGDRITWRCKNAFSVWFPPKHNPLKRGPNSGKKVLTRQLRSDALRGAYQYSIFCYGVNRMAVGNSSPEMIIQ